MINKTLIQLEKYVEIQFVSLFCCSTIVPPNLLVPLKPSLTSGSSKTLEKNFNSWHLEPSFFKPPSERVDQSLKLWPEMK